MFREAGARPDPGRAQSPWVAHRRRAEVLRERHPFAAEVLAVYLALLDVWEAGKDLLRAGRVKAVLITRGEEGMTLVERGRNACFHVPAFARQVFDVTGAGDTVIGTLAACLAAGATMREAAVLANIAASVVVGEVGTAPITAETLLRAVELRDREQNRPIA